MQHLWKKNALTVSVTISTRIQLYNSLHCKKNSYFTCVETAAILMLHKYRSVMHIVTTELNSDNNNNNGNNRKRNSGPGAQYHRKNTSIHIVSDCSCI